MNVSLVLNKQNVLKRKAFSVFDKYLRYRKFLKNAYANIEKERIFLTGRPIIVVGASPSALEIERLSSLGSIPSDYIIIGCNWTNFLDIDIDFFVSAYFRNCLIAAERERKIKWVLNASPHLNVRDERVLPVLRRNFGDFPELVLKSCISRSGGCLYTNKNVLFLMLSLAHFIGPSSITFCGFESPDSDPNWTHFFSGSKHRLDMILKEFVELKTLRNTSKDLGGDSAKEMLDFFYKYFWCDVSVNNGCGGFSGDERRRQESLGKKRRENIKKYLAAAEELNVSHYRLGATTLFKDLPLNTDLMWR